jgi:hypothetical protein
MRALFVYLRRTVNFHNQLICVVCLSPFYHLFCEMHITNIRGGKELRSETLMKVLLQAKHEKISSIDLGTF